MIKNPKPPFDAVQVVETHKEQAVETLATTARAEFFKLLERVVTDPTLLVFIEHRHLQERAVLVSERYLEYVRQLERVVGDLLAERQTQHGFAVCGTGKLHGDLEEAIAELREQERTEQPKRFAKL